MVGLKKAVYCSEDVSVQYCTCKEISATETEDEWMHGLNIQHELRVNMPIFSYVKGCHKEEEIFFHVCDRISSSNKGTLG